MSDAAAKTDAPPKKSKKGLIIGLAAVLLLAGGGGAGWFFLGRGEPDEAAAAAKADAKRDALRVFVTLDNFVVNLADRDSERYAQIGVVLEVDGKESEAKLTAKMPAVRNELLLLISSKLANQLTTREGKEQLAAEIAIAAARPLGWTPPEDEEEEEEAPAPKVKVKDGEKAKGAKSKEKAKAKKAEPAPNPVANVHFASFIVQ
ncbi:MAG: flagellar basal body rod protein [Burkholderiales bacterium]|nr:MAG: flagellar basal body rod protein [Burkholderiales bacterium]